MKRSLVFLSGLCLVLGLCTTACKKDPVEVTAVSINKKTLSLEEGQSEVLTANVFPDNAADKRLSWSSSATDVAGVDASGRLSALKEGTAVITATASNGVKDQCTITVKVPSVTGVRLDRNSLALKINQRDTLKATVVPANAGNKAVEWRSSNTSVVTVDDEGGLWALAAGEASVSVSTVEGGMTASCLVTVLIPVAHISMDMEDISIIIGGKDKVTATVWPENASNKKCLWSSSNNLVATVDANGEITTHKAGFATITATTEDGGFEAICYLSVLPLSTGTVRLNDGPELAFSTGQLSEVLSGTIEKLVFGTGGLNGSDVKAIMALRETLEHLDLTAATIVEGGEAYFPSEMGEEYTTSLYYIGRRMFYGMSALKTALLPENTSNIGWTAFSSCPLSSYNIPEGVGSVDYYAFSWAEMASVTLPASLSWLGYEYGTLGYLDNIYVAAGNPNIKSIDGVVYSFDGKNLLMLPRNRSSYTLAEGVSTLGPHCLDGSALQSLTIPSSVHTIEYNAISRTRDLETIVIPETVTRIGAGGISGNHALKTIIIHAVEPIERMYAYDVVNGNPLLTAIYVPDASVEAYKKAPGWENVADLFKPMSSL